MTDPTTPPALTDGHLRLVAAAIALDAVRDRADDTAGHIEELNDNLELAGVAPITIATLTGQAREDAAERIGELLATAEITIGWPEDTATPPPRAGRWT